MDLNKLTTGEKVVAAAGILLLIDSFLPWYSIDFGPLGSFHRSGWQSPGALWSILAVLLGVIMAGQVIATKLFSASGVPDKVGNFSWGMVHLAAGALSFLLIIIKLINESSSTGFAMWVGLILTAALGAGGFMIAKERGELPAQLGGAGGGTPPSA